LKRGVEYSKTGCGVTERPVRREGSLTGRGEALWKEEKRSFAGEVRHS